MFDNLVSLLKSAAIISVVTVCSLPTWAMEDEDAQNPQNPAPAVRYPNRVPRNKSHLSEGPDAQVLLRILARVRVEGANLINGQEHID